MCSGSEAGSYLRLIDSCITQPLSENQGEASVLLDHARDELVRLQQVHPYTLNLKP